MNIWNSSEIEPPIKDKIYLYKLRSQIYLRTYFKFQREGNLSTRDKIPVPNVSIPLRCSTLYPQVRDLMLVLMVLLLVIVDAVILSVYTVLEANREGASLVVNREKEITVTGVR